MRTTRRLSTGIFLCGLLSVPLFSSCGAKKQVNEGFPQSLEELNEIENEDSFWKLVREKLDIPTIAGSSLDQLLATLSDLPDALTDEDGLTSLVQSQTASLVSTAEKTVCSEIATPLVDLDPGKNFNIDGGFSFNGTTPQALALKAKVYLMKYKLSGDTVYRQAILTVPTTAPAVAHAAAPSIGVQTETSGSYGYPIFLYGHAGAGGLSYTEIASVLGTMQSAYIIAAPIFPGEPLCSTYDSGTSTCTGSLIASEALGTSQPYENDVIDYLGLHDCLKNLASSGAKAWANPTTGAVGTEDLSSKIVKISAEAQTHFAASSPIKAAAAGSPVSIAGGMGRGAAIAGLALARAGAYNAAFAVDATAGTLVSKGVKPPMFSCALLAAPQASFVSGSNRLLLESWVREGSNVLSSTDRALAEKVPGFAAIHAKIQSLRNDATLADNEAKATAIVNYVNSIDLLSQTYLMQVGLQNFGKVLTAARISSTDLTLSASTLKAAQGAMLLLHGTEDAVANVGNSALLSSYGVGLNSSLPSDGSVPGVRWLSLGISPPAANVDENGDLFANDYGHVDSSSFTSGLSSLSGGLDSNITETEYLEKTPAAVIASFLASQCAMSMNANSSQ